MQHALVVRGREARAELPRDLDRLVFRQPADAPQQRRQVFAVHVLHRQEVAPVDLADVEDAADVRMRDAQRHAHFVEEPLEPIRIALDVPRQELQRDRLAELQVVGAVDLAHAAAAEQADHAIAAADERAGQEPASGLDRMDTKPNPCGAHDGFGFVQGAGECIAGRA